MNQNTLANYLLIMLNSGFEVTKSKNQHNTFNLTKGSERIMIRQGWQENKFDWFATSVTNHSANGKLIGDTKQIAQWSENDKNRI